MNAGKLITGLLAFFLVCALVTSECLCAHPPFEGYSFDVEAFNPTSVRVYPKHTDFPSQPDHAELATYFVRQYTDGTEYFQWQNSPHTGHAWAAFSTEGGFLIADDTPWEGSAVTIDSSSYSIWRQADGPSYANYIEGYQRKYSVQWDLTELPVGAEVISSLLHTHTNGHFGGYADCCYVGYGATFGSAILAGNPVQHTVYNQEVSAGTAWVGGSEPWVMLECDILDERWPLMDLTTPPGSPYGAQDCFFYLTLGWGHRSEGLCTYMDITYSDPCVVTSVSPEKVFEEYTAVTVSGTGFTASTVLEIEDGFEIGAFSYINSTTMAASIRKVVE